MAQKNKTVYVCGSCGYESVKWVGQCPECHEWNTLTEQISVQKSTSPGIVRRAVSDTLILKDIDTSGEHRLISGISELDRVLGGGVVKGSVVLLCGDPGIGKSTILLQACEAFKKHSVLYISGEESAVQIKLRAGRLGVGGENVTVVTETDTMAVCEYIRNSRPDIVMVDSIQTMQIDEISSAAGSVVQVRESTNMLLRTVKPLDIPIFIVGHVNKGGEIAGPKVLEHIVDTVLYFEGERNQTYRILRSVKNRFGSTNEIGVFEMRGNGLFEVENPSAMMLSGRRPEVSGGCITCIMEGTRPILSEVQALVTTTGFGNPRRMSNGFDYNRLNMLLAILEKRQGLYFSNLDTYLNVVGGMRLTEPSADLAVCMALVSGLRDVPLSEKCIVFGEIGLSGEIRAVQNAHARVREAARLGFGECIMPKSSLKQINDVPGEIKLIGVRNIKEAIDIIR